MPVDPRIKGFVSVPWTWPAGASGTISVTIPATPGMGTLSTHATVFAFQTTAAASGTLFLTGAGNLTSAAGQLVHWGQVTEDAVPTARPYLMTGYFSQTWNGSTFVTGVDANQVAAGGTYRFSAPGSPANTTQPMNVSGLITFVFCDGAGGTGVFGVGIDSAHSTPGATLAGGSISAASGTATIAYNLVPLGLGNGGLMLAALGTQGATLSATADPSWYVLDDRTQSSVGGVPAVQQIVFDLTQQWAPATIPPLLGSVSPSAVWDSAAMAIGILPVPGPLPTPVAVPSRLATIVG